MTGAGIRAAVRAQYEQLPYPPVPWMALPSPRGASSLADPLFGSPRTILVTGGGTLEPAVVATAFPDASRIVAVDASEASSRVLSRRMAWMRAARFYRRIPPVEIITADLFEWTPDTRFDLVIATNVVHHTPRPADLLSRLASWVRVGGYLRMATYPRGSRLWLRETSRYLANSGVSPSAADAVARAMGACERLPDGDPVKSAFESHAERFDRAGLVDAFFHACELPLSPLDWERACTAAGLTLRAERQTESSRSSFLGELIPAARELGAWAKLDILDSALELVTSPVLLLEKGAETNVREFDLPAPLRQGPRAWLEDLQESILRVDSALAPLGSNARELAKAIAREVGPRSDGRRIYAGLTLGEYDLDVIREGGATSRLDILVSR